MTAAQDRSEDRLALLDLWGRYCASLDRGDIDSHVQLFTEDAVYHVYGRDVVGREKLRKMLSGAPHGLHLGGPPVIELVDDTCAHTMHNLYFVPVEDEPRRAVYTGEMRKTAAGWQIARWRCQFLTPEGLQDRP
jgi:ketosteroid isomerase-like protein